MNLDRISTDDESTLGLLWLDGVFQCFTLEDQLQTGAKIPGETRIPAGTYSVRVREDSPMAREYARRYEWHRGMLWLQDVPGFDWIYIHTGNTDDHTAGCILVGAAGYSMVGQEKSIGNSRTAYREFYPRVIDAAFAGELSITIEDNERRK